MKSGVRAVGVAESYHSDAATSTVAGCVVRADRVVDGIAYTRCTVGGMDVTDAIINLFDRLDREDIRYVLIAGVALAWYNLVDVRTIEEAVERPVIAVSFEESDGLETAIRSAVEDPAPRLAVYDSLPDRTPMTVNGESVYVRSVGCDDESPTDIVAAFTPEGGRPEPLRVARFAARAGDVLWHETTQT